MSAALPLAIAGALALILSVLACRAVMAAGVWDHPRLVRQQHRKTTPTSGGLGVAIATLAALAAAISPPLADMGLGLNAAQVMTLAGVAAAALLAGALGLLDDIRPLGPRVKFVLIAALAVLFSTFVARAEGLPLWPGMVLAAGPAFAIIGSALFFFTLVNATNFMDGANGLAMGTVAIGLLGLGAIGLAHDAPHVGLLGLTGAAALAGLLVWNFPAGKMFAGDSGALFAGALAAAGALALVEDGGVSPFLAAILFFPILADVLLTLLWRLGKGRPLLAGHRDHLYQVGLRAGLSHMKVTLIYWAIAGHCALIAFVAAYGGAVGGYLPMLDGVAPPLMIAAFVAALAPVLALAVLAFVAIRLSKKVRAFATARGVDGE